MDTRYGFNKGGSSHWRPYRSEEFREEDMWDVVINNNRENGFINGESCRTTTTPHSISRRLPSAAKMIPAAQRYQSHDRGDEPKMMQHSAPVNIPDWSKIYGKSPKKDDVTSTSIHDHHDYDDDDFRHGDPGESDGDGFDDDDDGKLPPHEWLAKKLARSQISSFSVCEGAGRTLKGRDLSRVRHAVLSKTGFI